MHRETLSLEKLSALPKSGGQFTAELEREPETVCCVKATTQLRPGRPRPSFQQSLPWERMSPTLSDLRVASPVKWGVKG